MHLLNDKMMQALCWTLIHSLWQGLLLAIMGGVVVLVTRRSGSIIRYNLLSVLFFLFVGAACFTFARQWQAVQKINPVHESIAGENTLAAGTIPAVGAEVEKTNPEVLVSYFNEHASLIVLIWFIILSAQFVRLIANAGYAQRIKHYRTHAPGAYWKKRMLELAERLNIKQRVILLQSEIVKVPVMVGFLKPVILFPFGLMMQLPPEQVEAVLLHELAHIKRKDYLVNLLQHVAEIIFFFNPGLLWISSLIRDERENCCDDIAIGETRSKKEFIHALVSFQEYNLPHSNHSLAFPGRKNHLLNRIKRILTSNNKTLNNMEKISLAAGVIIFGMIAIAFTQTPKNQVVNPGQPVNSLKIATLHDTIPDPETETEKFTYGTVYDGIEYKILEEHGKVTRLYVDHKRIPDEKIGDYKEIIEKLQIQAKADRDQLEAETRKLAQESEQLKLEQEKMQRDLNGQGLDSMAILNKKKAEEFNLMAIRGQEDAMRMLEDSKDQQLDLKKQLQEQNAEIMALNEQVRKQQELMKQEAKTLNEKESKTQAEILKKQMFVLKQEQFQIELQRKKINEMIKDGDESALARLSAPAIQADLGKSDALLHELQLNAGAQPPLLQLLASPALENSEPLRLIIAELMDRKIISSKDNISMVLNNETLIVNDVVQPEKLHAEFKERYLKSPKDHVNYSRHGSSVHSDIIIDSGSMKIDGNINGENK